MSLQWQQLGFGGKEMSVTVDVFVYAAKTMMKWDVQVFQG